jgi:mRNA-degrading endonuclease RelE of RelBE toxin-antitoxin system
VQEQVLRSRNRFAADPRSAASLKALKGSGEYHLRVGWSVVYTLHDDGMTVLVVPIAHRQEVYR